eukprot:361553-Chlamydomonas_euryale.AAC.1
MRKILEENHMPSASRRSPSSPWPFPQVLATFREGLGFERTAAQPSPRLELPPKPGSDDDALAVVLGVVLSVAVVLASVLAVYFVLRRHHRSLLGRPLMPQPGDETTLAVSQYVPARRLASRVQVALACKYNICNVFDACWVWDLHLMPLVPWLGHVCTSNAMCMHGACASTTQGCCGRPL